MSLQCLRLHPMVCQGEFEVEALGGNGMDEGDGLGLEIQTCSGISADDFMAIEFVAQDGAA